MIRATVHQLAIGVAVGGVAGCGSFVFLRSLDWATSTRTGNPWLVWLLPLAGLMVGLTHHHVGGDAVRGTNLVLDELHAPTSLGVPRRMAPLALAGATVTHLFGGSGGREGAAVQIAASLTAPFRRLSVDVDRRIVMVASIAGGFGSVFGVPWAGSAFGVEAPTVGRPSMRQLPAAVAASFTGDRVARLLGISHHRPAPVSFALGVRELAAVVIVGTASGICAAAFIGSVHSLRRRLTRRIAVTWLHPFVGGVAVLILLAVSGTRAYLGLSLPLLDTALAGATIAASAFAWKLVFTVCTIGSGFPGGEVTPLFCVGACLGSALGHLLAAPLDVGRPALAAFGMLAVFGAASKTPVACTIVGVELFGLAIWGPLLLACLIATVVSGDRSIYGQQRVARHVRTLRRANAGATSRSLSELGGSRLRRVGLR